MDVHNEESVDIRVQAQPLDLAKCILIVASPLETAHIPGTGHKVPELKCRHKIPGARQRFQHRARELGTRARHES